MSGPKVCGGHNGEIVGIAIAHCPPGRCAICGAPTGTTSFREPVRLVEVPFVPNVPMMREAAARLGFAPRLSPLWAKLEKTP